jgi:flagellar FliJ protein
MPRAFQFRLETLLRVRRLREREAQRNLAAKQAEIARVERLSRQAADELRACRDELLGAQERSALDPPLLVRQRAWIAHVHRSLLEQESLKARLIGERRELQEVLRNARTQVRMLEKLRGKRWEEYARRARHDRQAASDELARTLLAYGQDASAFAGDAARSQGGRPR